MNHTIPPRLFDLEAEQAVLGSIVYRNDLLPQVSPLLSPTSFHAPAHQLIFAAMLALDEKQLPIDEVLLGDRLKAESKLEACGGYPYLAELVDCVPASGNAVHYAQVVAQLSQVRDLAFLTREQTRRLLAGQCDPMTFLAELNSKAQNLVLAKGQARSRSIKDLQPDMHERLERISAAGEPQGLLSGLVDLDQILLGFDPGKLYVVAGRPSMGKTAFAGYLALAFSLTRHQAPGLIVSLEMATSELNDRFHSQLGKINSNKFRTGELIPEEWDRLAWACDQLAQAPIYMEDRTHGIEEIRTEAWFRDAELKAGGGPGLGYLMVDYLQLANGTVPGQIREQEIAEISRGLKMLAKEMSIPVIALSQLNRSLESRKDKRPMLSDLRESGAIEQDADVVMFVYRDEVYDAESPDKGLAEIDVAKQRNGATGRIKLRYHGPTYRFKSLSQIQPANSKDIPW